MRHVFAPGLRPLRILGDPLARVHGSGESAARPGRGSCASARQRRCERDGDRISTLRSPQNTTRPRRLAHRLVKGRGLAVAKTMRGPGRTARSLLPKLSRAPARASCLSSSRRPQFPDHEFWIPGGGTPTQNCIRHDRAKQSRDGDQSVGLCSTAKPPRRACRYR